MIDALNEFVFRICYAIGFITPFWLMACAIVLPIYWIRRDMRKRKEL